MHKRLLNELVSRGVAEREAMRYIKLWGDNGCVVETLLYYKNTTFFHFRSFGDKTRIIPFLFRNVPLIVPIYIASVGI